MNRNDSFTYYLLMVSATLHMHDQMPKDLWQRRIRNLLDQLIPLMENQHKKEFIAAGTVFDAFMDFNECIKMVVDELVGTKTIKGVPMENWSQVIDLIRAFKRGEFDELKPESIKRNCAECHCEYCGVIHNAEDCECKECGDWRSELKTYIP